MASKASSAIHRGVWKVSKAQQCTSSLYQSPICNVDILIFFNFVLQFIAIIAKPYYQHLYKANSMLPKIEKILNKSMYRWM